MILIPKGKPIKVQQNTQHNKEKPNYKSTAEKKYKNLRWNNRLEFAPQFCVANFLFAFFPPCITHRGVVLVYSGDNRRQE